jgi:hypothetical protein
MKWLKGLVMRKKLNYKNVNEWLADLDKLRDQPTDIKLETAIVRRVNGSSDEVKQDIRKYLQEATLFSDNPFEAMVQIANEQKDKYLIVNGEKNQIWFDV